MLGTNCTILRAKLTIYLQEERRREKNKSCIFFFIIILVFPGRWGPPLVPRPFITLLLFKKFIIIKKNLLIYFFFNVIGERGGRT